ncbi:unnamed protein product, partial [Angiostrongylus costaricensis]|uniref:Peptidase A1 domain-containing protein n=1 Tax=Angiostrongylus costaricensis TaxID=334426 RepID=A0A0R3Q160_ANGCS
SAVTIQQHVFFSAENIAQIFVYIRFDGIIGLAWLALFMSNSEVRRLVFSASTPMQNLLSSLDARIFTAWLNTAVNHAIKNELFINLFKMCKLEVAHFKAGEDKERGNNGLITFGAIDTSNCSSEIHYVPLSAEKYWEFIIEDFSVGNFSKRRAECALAFFEVDYGTTGFDWILGANWIHTYCNIYDFGQKRIGFVKAKQQE